MDICERHMCVGAFRGQKSEKQMLDSLELELQVGHQAWMLGTKPRSSGRAASTLSHWTLALPEIFTEILYWDVCKST